MERCDDRSGSDQDASSAHDTHHVYRYQMYPLRAQHVHDIGGARYPLLPTILYWPTSLSRYPGMSSNDPASQDTLFSTFYVSSANISVS